MACAALACASIAIGADEPAGGSGVAAVTATANPAVAQPAYWQVPPLPTAVIQGGAIPPGWQPQAVPYQGVGPDGRPVTMYFAPTYVFTYQSGPPMPGVPQVNRGGLAAQPAAAPMPAGWNYATTGAAPVATTLPLEFHAMQYTLPLCNSSTLLRTQMRLVLSTPHNRRA